MRGRTWLDDERFTVGDLMMCSVLRELMDESLLTGHPGVEAYTRRGLGRPGFQKALADQLADFVEPPL